MACLSYSLECKQAQQNCVPETPLKCPNTNVSKCLPKNRRFREMPSPKMKSYTEQPFSDFRVFFAKCPPKMNGL